MSTITSATPYNDKTTKGTIIAILEATKAERDAALAGKLNPAIEVESKRKIDVSEKVQAIISGPVSLSNQITTLQSSVETFLEDLKNDYSSRFSALDAVQQQINIKEAELKELFGIEAKAYELTTFVNAQSELKAAQEKDDAERIARTQTTLEDLLAKISAARAEHESLKLANAAELKLTKERDTKNWEYELSRLKKTDKDELADELATTRANYEAKVKVREEGLAAREKAVQDAEVNVANRESKIGALEAEVAAFPAKLAAVKDDAASTIKAEVGRIVAIQGDAAKKHAEADKKVTDKENELLVKQVTTLEGQLSTTTAKLDDAYARIQDMGVKMVQGAQATAAADRAAATAANTKA